MHANYFHCNVIEQNNTIIQSTSTLCSSFFAADGWAGTDNSILRHADTVAHHFNAICGGGGGVCRGPRTTTSFGPQRELPLASLVIHRQTSARVPRNETLNVQSRSGIWHFFAPNSIRYG